MSNLVLHESAITEIEEAVVTYGKKRVNHHDISCLNFMI